MKIILKKLRFIPLILLTITLASCSSDDDSGDPTPTPMNIVGLAQNTPDLSILVEALGAADGNLVSVLNGNGPFTVLAPTNAAFGAFLAANNFNSLDEVPTDILAQILLNHVIAGNVTSADLTNLGNGYSTTQATNADGDNLSLYFNTSSGVRFNNVASVTSTGADIVATNGIVHIIDAVIPLPTVVTFATADPNFSTLVSALTTLTPDTDFASILSRTSGGNADGINPDFTVFAPTNTAFDMLDAVPEASVLTQVLLHHVISGANIRSGDLTNGVSPEMLNGQNITINLPGTGDNIADVTDGAGNSDIGISAVDVQAVNGVIHVLNKVLLPGS